MFNAFEKLNERLIVGVYKSRIYFAKKILGNIFLHCGKFVFVLCLAKIIKRRLTRRPCITVELKKNERNINYKY